MILTTEVSIHAKCKQTICLPVAGLAVFFPPSSFFSTPFHRFNPLVSLFFFFFPLLISPFLSFTPLLASSLFSSSPFHSLPLRVHFLPSLAPPLPPLHSSPTLPHSLHSFTSVLSLPSLLPHQLVLLLLFIVH